MNAKQRGMGNLSLIVTVVVLLIVALAAYMFLGRVRLTATYYAVFLDSGQAYFGKLDSLGAPWAPYITLTDVYYVQSVTNQETKQTSNILVKRGKEWHGPDRMIINTRHLVLVEPVSEGSKVAQLITESKGK